ncbi:MAG TPA: LLM class F420-dependent oxidoreductase [Candidatus Binataceae bacterium]|jgi:probable F420-dependent oxidoreductase|nr:LLM class F420-dependent oxidoreductase [Candidatus Binataceae bacterium]
MTVGLQAFVSESTADPARIARKAEALGFDSIFIPEHPIIPVHHRTPYPLGDGSIPEFYAHMPDPFVSLAHAAAATTRIKLATGICLVPERDPIVMAKEIATLDFWSGGRFLFGIGAGWLADESEIMGVDFKRRWPMTREYIAAMKELWTRPEPSFEGKFVRFPKVKFFPKPVQKPHPPVIIGAGGIGPSCERALKDTVAMGDGWMPLGLSPAQLATELGNLRRMCAEAKRDFGRIEITFLMLELPKEPARAIHEYHEAGAHRVLVSAPTLAPDNFERELEELARACIR